MDGLRWILMDLDGFGWIEMVLWTGKVVEVRIAYVGGSLRCSIGQVRIRICVYMAEYVCERQTRRGNSASPGNRAGQTSLPQTASSQAEPGRSGN